MRSIYDIADREVSRLFSIWNWKRNHWQNKKKSNVIWWYFRSTRNRANTLNSQQSIYDLPSDALVLLCHHQPWASCNIVKLRVAHAPGWPEAFSSPPRVSDPDMHHSTCDTHVPWCMQGLLISGFHWSRWQAKRSRYSRRMRNPQF